MSSLRGKGRTRVTRAAETLWCGSVRGRFGHQRGYLADYQGRTKVARHVFCRNCGIRPYEWIDTPNMSGHKYFTINLACLDGVDIDELMGAPVSYPDGLNDAWGITGKRDTPLVATQDRCRIAPAAAAGNSSGGSTPSAISLYAAFSMLPG